MYFHFTTFLHRFAKKKANLIYWEEPAAYIYTYNDNGSRKKKDKDVRMTFFFLFFSDGTRVEYKDNATLK